MTERNESDLPDHGLPTAGRMPPQQPAPARAPGEDRAEIALPGDAGERLEPGGVGDAAELTEPFELSGEGSRGAGPAAVGEPGDAGESFVPSGGAGDEGQGAVREPGEQTVALAGVEGQEPAPGRHAGRVSHSAGVDDSGAVGDGDGPVRDDVLVETADRAAAAAAQRRREAAGEAPVGDSGDSGDSGAAGAAGEEAGAAGRRRRLSPAGALILVLLALFGFTVVAQLRSNNDDQGLATARQEDLVRILSDLEARDSRLQTEIAGLESSQRQLTSGVSSRQAALAEAAKRADELGLLAGTLPGKGPGLKIVIDKVKASAILNTVEELRGAGGEVMELAGNDGVTVRIVASSYFVDAEGGGIVADGARVTGPYTLWVIGSPQTMQTALQIPGGVVASVTGAGGSVTMEAQTLVQVAAVRKATTLQYAHPVS